MNIFANQKGNNECIPGLALPYPESNRAFDPMYMIVSFWLRIWTGTSKYLHYDWLRYDITIHKIYEWTKKPLQSAYSRFFGSFSYKRNTRVFPCAQKWFVDNLGIDIYQLILIVQ